VCIRVIVDGRHHRPAAGVDMAQHLGTDERGNAAPLACEVGRDRASGSCTVGPTIPNPFFSRSIAWATLSGRIGPSSLRDVEKTNADGSSLSKSKRSMARRIRGTAADGTGTMWGRLPFVLAASIS
jgi:hypothetical protein